MTKQVGMKMWYSENTSFLLVGISSLYLWVFFWYKAHFFLSHLQNCVTTPASMPWAQIHHKLKQWDALCQNAPEFVKTLAKILKHHFLAFPISTVQNWVTNYTVWLRYSADLGGNMNNSTISLDKISVMIGHYSLTQMLYQ